jgi:hypothetical protein
MHVGDRKRPPLLPKAGWLSDGRQVLPFKPLRYDRWSQSLEVTFGEVMPSGEPPLLKRRGELTREQAISSGPRSASRAGGSVRRSGSRRSRLAGHRQ